MFIFKVIMITPIQLCSYNSSSIKDNSKPVFKGVVGVEKVGKVLKKDTGRKFLIQETAFFREMPTLNYVKKYVDNILITKPQVNIVDGACSKGYETWSLRMLNNSDRVNILGFDLGKSAVDEAKSGKFIISKFVDSSNNVSLSGYKDNFLAFGTPESLTKEQMELKSVFDKFFEVTTENVPKLSLYEKFNIWIIKNFYKINSDMMHKYYKVRPEFADKCQFVEGNILNMDKFLEAKSTNVLFFRNALYHLTTKEGKLGYKKPLPEAKIQPVLGKVAEQIDKVLTDDGIFVLGTHPSDHFNESGKVVHDALKKKKFIPIIDDDGYASIWKRADK